MIQRENGIKDDCCNLTINRVDNGGIEGSGSIRFFNAAGVEKSEYFLTFPPLALLSLG
jgi:hypothetical protein